MTTPNQFDKLAREIFSAHIGCFDPDCTIEKDISKHLTLTYSKGIREGLEMGAEISGFHLYDSNPDYHICKDIAIKIRQEISNFKERKYDV